MFESHESEDSHDPHDESPIRAKDEEPIQAHGGHESEQPGGAGAGPEGLDSADTHKPPARQEDE